LTNFQKLNGNERKRDLKYIKPACNIGFCASEADGINISICAAIISSPGRRISFSKRTNNQLFYSTFGDGSGRREF